MKNTRLWIAALLSAGLLAACRRGDQIQTYTAPKDAATPTPDQTAPAMAMSDPSAPVITPNSAPVHWTTPSGWRELPPTSMRLGNFVVASPDGKQAEVTITSFPGDVGGELLNVNRWRHENNLDDISENDIHSQPATVDSIAAKLYDIAGASKRTVVAVVSRDGASWFFKMHGDPDAVTAAQPAFLQFLSTVHFGETAAASPTADPHAGMNMTPTASSSDAGPKWTAPAGWSETTPGPMVTKSFSVTGNGGQKAVVSVSVLGGGGGGILANVNRWRGQINLPEVGQGDLSTVTTSLDVADGKATVVDFTGTDKTGQPSRLMAVVVPHGADTWFYKLMGDGAVVERERENFVKFIQSARY